MNRYRIHLLDEQIFPKPYNVQSSLMSDPEQISLLMDSSARTGSMSWSMSKKLALSECTGTLRQILLSLELKTDL
jgi:hypothetical protein